MKPMLLKISCRLTWCPRKRVYLFFFIDLNHIQLCSIALKLDVQRCTHLTNLTFKLRVLDKKRRNTIQPILFKISRPLTWSPKKMSYLKKQWEKWQVTIIMTCTSNLIKCTFFDYFDAVLQMMKMSLFLLMYWYNKYWDLLICTCLIP